MLFLLKFITLLTCFSSVYLQSSNQHGETCTITEDELAELMEMISSLCNQKTTETTHGCEKLLTTTVNTANSLKSILSSKIQEIDRVYYQTELILMLQEQNLTEQLEEIPKNFQAKYKSDIERMTKELLNQHELIDKLQLEQEDYDADYSYYLDYLNNGTAFVSRFDFDSYFEEAKQCTFRKNRVNLLINEFNEIFTLVFSDSSKFISNDCFTELRQKIGNIERIIDHRIGEHKINSLKNTYEERSKCLRKLIDDYTLQNEQKALQNVTFVSDSLHALKLEYERSKVETEKKRKQTAFKGFQTVRQMILEGTKFKKARDIFLKIRKEIPDSYAQILIKTYNCNANNLHATLRFALIIDRFLGCAIIKEKMKDCGQLTSPFILQIASTMKDETLNSTVDEVYDGWLSQIRLGHYEQIQDFMKLLDDNVISFQKLFKKALNAKSSDIKIKHLLAFIDSLNPYDQKVVKILYDVMMEKKLAYTHEHFEIAQWIIDKLNLINQQLSNSAITGDLKEHLDVLKEKLPNSLRIFFFEPSIILATQDNEYLMRSDSHIGVKFKVISDHSKQFYRFEDLRYEKSFYATRFRDVKTKIEKIWIRLGSGNTDNYFWSIIPSDQEEFFHLENKQFPGNFLSSYEDNVCLQKSFWGNCNMKEWMNRLSTSKSSSTKWTFTSRLIRNGILPDRNEG